jgi:exodeoxyribonuclease VII large subunit
MNNRETFNERPVYTLTEIAQSLHSVVSKAYPNPYYIKAEIVRLNYYPHSGHCYPELAEKENNKIKTQMRAIIWATHFREINARFIQLTGEGLKDGINILCLATVAYDVKYGMSLHIQHIEPSYTLGEMVRQKLWVIERLKKEHIFDANKRCPLAVLPKRIAVISVETSKGYGDFMVTLQNNPYHYRFHCTLFPSILQGDKAIETIVARLEDIEKRVEQFDCVVIIRGGGGDVGLNCYDDYTLAVKVASCPLPVIAGIGHSTNVTVTDMVAYQSKITPTDVANFFIERFREFDMTVEDCKIRLWQLASKMLQETRANLLALQQRQGNVARWLAPKKAQWSVLQKHLSYLVQQKWIREKEKWNVIEEKMSLLHPDNILKRGYSITFHEGKAVKDASALKNNDKITIKLWKGEVTGKIEN